MDVMGVNHPLKILRTRGGSPLDALVNNYIVEYEIEDAVSKNSDCNGKKVGIE